MNEDPNLCRVTIVGPAAKEEKKRLLRLKAWTGPEWRRLIIEIRVGTERWPDWDQAKVCLCAIQDLIKMNEGFLNDAVIQALTTHVDVVSYQTFNGPPKV